MNLSTKQLQKIPKIQVSFQDDFSGSEREYKITPRYVVNELYRMGIRPKIGDTILLWEKDVKANNVEYYICAIAQILEASKVVKSIVGDEEIRLDDKAIMIVIDRYFDLPINSFR